MYLAGEEALAGLQLVVAVAKADGPLTAAERTIIAESLEDAHLPDGITAVALISSSYDVDSLVGQVTSQHGRDVAFAACLTIAHTNRVFHPRQQAILDKIDHAWFRPMSRTPRARQGVPEVPDRRSAGRLLRGGRQALSQTDG